MGKVFLSVLTASAVLMLVGCESLDKGYQKVESLSDPLLKERDIQTPTGKLEIRPEEVKKAKISF